MREVDAGRAKLLAARAKRERPLTDDKILADWNGMVITGLAVAGKLLGEPDLLERAARAAEFVLRTMRPGTGGPAPRLAGGAGEDRRLSRRLRLPGARPAGPPRAHGGGALARRRPRAHRRADRAPGRSGGGFFVAAASPDVLFRSKEVFDGAMPAANAVAVLNLLELAERTGDRALARRGAARSVRLRAAVSSAPGRGAHAGPRRPPLPRDGRRPGGGRGRATARPGPPTSATPRPARASWSTRRDGW